MANVCGCCWFFIYFRPNKQKSKELKQQRKQTNGATPPQKDGITSTKRQTSIRLPTIAQLETRTKDKHVSPGHTLDKNKEKQIIHHGHPLDRSPTTLRQLASTPTDCASVQPHRWRHPQWYGYSSGAVWESRWTSWAVRPNEPSGFRGRKELLNRVSALVTTCP